MRGVTDPKDAARRAAAAAAVERIEPGMTIGLGSGRAVWKVLEAICERWPGEVPLGVVPAADVRCSDDGAPFITDEGHVIVDCALPRAGDLDEFAVGLKAVIGVVEHGLFLDMADEALLGALDGTLETIPT